MKPTLALVAAGPLHRGSLARIPAVTERLGPVVAPSPRVARAWVKSLRAGHPAHRYSALQESRTVLVCAPDPLVPEVASELAAAELDWERKVALLCGGTLASTELGPLAARGAATGSLTPLADLGMIVEGDRAAVREARRLFRHTRLRLHRIETSQKAVCLAAVSFGTILLTPLLEAAVQCLRQGGFNSSAASALAGSLFQNTLRYAGRNPRRVRLDDPDTLRRQAEALHRSNPALMRYFSRSVSASAELFGLPAPAQIPESRP